MAVAGYPDIDEATHLDLLTILSNMRKADRLEYCRSLQAANRNLLFERPTLDTQPTSQCQDTRPSRKAPKRRTDTASKAFSGDGSNMRKGSGGGGYFLWDQVPFAHTGATRVKAQSIMEPVFCRVEDTPGGYDDGFRGPTRTPESFVGLVR